MERRITDVKPEDFRKEYEGEAISNIIIDMQKELYILRQMLEQLMNNK